MTPGPVVAGTRLAPGHDGRAELVVELAHPGGSRSTLSVDEDTVARILTASGAGSVDDLVGRSWTELTTPRPT